MTLARTGTVVVLCLALTGCLEPPVSEALEIRLLPHGASIVTVRVSLGKPSDYEDSPKVRQRLEGETRAFAEGTDPWSPRIEAGAPSREREVRDLEDGRLRRVTRHVRFEKPEDLGSFLRDTGVGVSFASGEGWEELTILPGRSGRPTTAQRERVKAELASWSAKLSAYFGAVSDLYGYLAEHPDRARACLASILTKLPPGEHLSDREAALTKAVEDTMGECGSVLAVPPDEPYTIDELSRFVYDPFPAPIRLTVPGPVVEREGFEGDLDAPLVIPDVSLWSAFTGLEGRFVSPDPAVALWRQDTAGDGKEIDVEAFAAQARRSTQPGTTEVRTAIEDRLRTAPVYRVRFAPGPDAAPLPFDVAP